MVGFTKLFSCITSSSIWNEDDKTRIVWITMLALAGPDGLVAASVGGLAHTARVTREDCEKALTVLQSPDPDSRSPEFDGRRIEKVEGGFFLLNYGKYREARSDDERRAYMREYMQSYRKKTVNKSKQPLAKVSQSEPPLANAEAEEKQKEKQNPTTGGEGENPKASKNLPTTETSKRIAALFHRRFTTAWSDREVKAYKELGVVNLDDLALLESYYATERAKGDDGRHRRDLLTFLNNFPGELDRARAPKPAANGHKSNALDGLKLV